MARQVARLIALGLWLFAASAAAQPSPERLKTPQTQFGTLSADERRILAPVEQEWDRMPGYQQQRLISSARRYPKLEPIQKERFDNRIRGWAAMSPEQRREARETFKGLRRLTPAQQHELRERWLERHRGEGTPPGGRFEGERRGAPDAAAREPEQPGQRRPSRRAPENPR